MSAPDILARSVVKNDMKNRRRYVFFAVIIVFLGWLGISAWQEVGGAQDLQVVFFDVGQGDSIFIETPDGKQILIDGGPGTTVLEKLDQYMPSWDKSIDIVLLTHSDNDHLEGLVHVLEQFDVHQIIWSGVTKDTQISRRWDNALRNELEGGAQEIIADDSHMIILSHSGDLYLDILGPDQDNLPSESNDTSVVAQLIYKKDSFLFTGDISSQVEAGLVESENLTSDILKIAHHGSKSSSSRVFLEEVNPRFAVIQVGRENRYSHPHDIVIKRLLNYGITPLRTDEIGDIVLRSNGNSF